MFCRMPLLLLLAVLVDSTEAKTTAVFICLPVSQCATWEVLLMVLSILLTIATFAYLCLRLSLHISSLGKQEEPELPLHQRSVQEREPFTFTCHHLACGQTFSTRSVLNRHLRRVHNIKKTGL
jgi:hypothetical protein